MAIGLGRLFCVELPVNFKEPYLAANPREFWQCWHITLSYWLRDYAYVRMGGRESYVRDILFFLSPGDYWAFSGELVTARWGVAVFGLPHLVFLAAVGFVTFGLRERLWLYGAPFGRHRLVDSPTLAALLMFAGLLCVSLSKTFIYFRF